MTSPFLLLPLSMAVLTVRQTFSEKCTNYLKSVDNSFNLWYNILYIWSCSKSCQKYYNYMEDSHEKTGYKK